MKFIYEFELVKLFPPVHLIKAHLRLTKKAVKKIRKKGKLSLEAQVCTPLVHDSMSDFLCLRANCHPLHTAFIKFPHRKRLQAKNWLL